MKIEKENTSIHFDNSPSDIENRRVEALHNYNILDTAAEKEFDRLTELAAMICETPLAAISLVDDARQWFKSKVGHSLRKTKREITFCQYAIQGDSLFEIEDATKDDRFSNFPFVLDKPNIRFYAGYPLIDPEGYALGTLCVMDHKVKKLNEVQRIALSTLAKEVVLQIVARKEKVDKKHFEELFMNSIDMVCIAGTDGYFKKVNPAFSAVLGWESKELTEIPFLDFVHKDDKESTRLELAKLSHGIKTINFYNRYLTKNGDYKILSWVANPDLSTGTIYAIARDQTEDVKAQNRILQAEKKFRDVFENSPDAIFIEDGSGNILDVNSAACNIQGLTKEHLISSNIRNLVPREKYVKILTDYKKLFFGAVNLVESSVWSISNGETHEIPVEISGKKISYGDKEVLLLQVRDISERKKMEEERARIIVDRNKRQAEQIRTSLKVKEEERNRIAVEMHDEVGCGLSRISILGHVIKKSNADPGIVASNIDKILSSSKAVQENISEIIWAMNSKNDSLENLVAYINYYVSEFLNTSNIEFKLNLPESLPSLVINGSTRRNIFLVVKESLNNLFKYAGATMVKIDISLTNGLFSVWINDNGKGFDIDNVRRFSNGIQNMRKRMKDVNGVFEIVSRENVGTTVFLQVPIAVVE